AAPTSASPNPPAVQASAKPPSAAASDKAPSPAASSSAGQSQAQTPAASASASAIPAGMGDILTQPSAAGHRIFVDDRVLGNSPDPVRVRCGKHSVRIGSAGMLKDVDVPCAGSIVVTP